MKVFKFPLVTNYIFGVFYVDMQSGAQVLSVGLQGDTMTLWALVDENAPMVTREVIVVPTGHTTINNTEVLRFIGTVQYDSGIVAHVFLNTIE